MTLTLIVNNTCCAIRRVVKRIWRKEPHELTRKEALIFADGLVNHTLRLSRKGAAVRGGYESIGFNLNVAEDSVEAVCMAIKTSINRALKNKNLKLIIKIECRFAKSKTSTITLEF